MEEEPDYYSNEFESNKHESIQVLDKKKSSMTNNVITEDGFVNNATPMN